jgi:PleD family two-component response regulator
MAKILILQEMEQNIVNLKQALVPRGHKLLVAKRELQALELLKHENVDLIVSAVYLEQSDVFDFLKAVKHNSHLANVPVVFYCSAISTFARSVRNGLKIAAEACGVDLYITMETFNPEILAEQIEDCLASCSERSFATVDHDGRLPNAI